jgi:regulator of replication initiation timing
MNLYKPTGEKLESWPQWVARLIKENQELREEIAELKKKLAEKDDK